MKKHVYERIGQLMERNEQLQKQLDQVTGGQVYQRLLVLAKSEKELLDHLQCEKRARQELLQDVERLEQENSCLQRKTDRFNEIKDELKLTQHSHKNVERQLEAAWQEIDQLKKNQSGNYLKVI